MYVVFKWAAWCVENSPVYDYAVDDLQHFLEMIVERMNLFSSYFSKDFPVVPRRMVDDNTGDVPVERLPLFLGKEIKNACSNCGQEAIKRCKRCRNALYCSKKCQVSHWHSEHKNECK